MAKLRCRFGHQFTTAAKPGGTTGCPECRRGGVRTSVRVPVAKQAASTELEHQGDDDAARLAALWAAEAPAVTDWRRTPTEPSPWQCDGCGGTLLWHSAHTALVCLACPTNQQSPAMLGRAETHAEAIARRRNRAAGVGAELAVIDPAAEARARAGRVDLHRNREALAEYADQMLSWCDADYQRAPVAALAFQIGSTVRGYLTEIRHAPDNATLTEIGAEVRAIREGAEFAQIVAEYNRQEEQAEAAAERAERWAAAEAQRAADEAEAARAAAAARHAQALAEQQARAAQAQRRTVPEYPAAQSMVLLAKVISDHQARQAARRERNGTCGWCKKVAGRRYGIGTEQGQWLQAYASAVACPKHYPAADKWLEQQEAGTFRAWYWELDAA